MRLLFETSAAISQALGFHEFFFLRLLLCLISIESKKWATPSTRLLQQLQLYVTEFPTFMSSYLNIIFNWATILIQHDLIEEFNFLNFRFPNLFLSTSLLCHLASQWFDSCYFRIPRWLAVFPVSISLSTILYSALSSGSGCWGCLSHRSVSVCGH